MIRRNARSRVVDCICVLLIASHLCAAGERGGAMNKRFSTGVPPRPGEIPRHDRNTAQQQIREKK